MVRLVSSGLLLAGSALALAPAASAAPAVIGSSSKATTVSAYGDVVAWSTYHPGSRRYKLTARVGTRVRELPIRSRTVPFDVDLGPGARGGVAAVYSRCRVDPDHILPGGSLPQPNYSRGNGCDIYRYDFSTGREAKVLAVSGSSSSEYMPSIWGDRIAFARVYERRRGRAGAVTWVYTRRLVPGARTVRVPAGPWGYFDIDGVLKLPHAAGGAGVMGMDLASRQLALAWEYWPLANGGPYPGDPRYEIRLDTLGGGQKLVAAISTPEDINNGFFGPSLVNGDLMFGGFDPAADPGDYVVRYSIAAGTLESARVDGWLVSQSSAGSHTFTVRGGGPGAFRVEEQRELSFSPGIPKDVP
jgi:hypothetical protein